MNNSTLHFAYEALQPQPPVDWLVQDFISAGTLAVLVGDAGSGKTYAALEMAVCLAMGKAWLGTRATKQTTVLFVDEESGNVSFNRRLAAIMNAHNADGSLQFVYTNFAGFDLRKTSNLQKLHELIVDTSAGFVVIDALMDVTPGADENSTKDMAPVMNGLKTIIEKTGASICVVHHLNKNGGYRGSSSIKGVVDSMVLVEKKQNRLTFKSVKNRDGELFEFAADAHFEADKFYLTDVDKNSIQSYADKFDALSKAEKTIIEHLARYGESTKSDIENLPGSAKRTLGDAIYILANRGYVERTDGGGQGITAFYNLTTSGLEIAVFAGWINDPWIIADFGYVKV